MELDLSFFIVTAAVSCVLFNLHDGGETVYAKEREALFFKFTLALITSAFSGSSAAVITVYFMPQADYLLPLISVSSALLADSFVQRLRLFKNTERLTCELMLLSAVLSVFLSSGVSDDITMSFIRLGIASALFTAASVLLYFTTVRFLSPNEKKQPLFLSGAAICASSLGFAAEGFKGILENLFT